MAQTKWNQPSSFSRRHKNTFKRKHQKSWNWKHFWDSNNPIWEKYFQTISTGWTWIIFGITATWLFVEKHLIFRWRNVWMQDSIIGALLASWSRSFILFQANCLQGCKCNLFLLVLRRRHLKAWFLRKGRHWKRRRPAQKIWICIGGTSLLSRNISCDDDDMRILWGTTPAIVNLEKLAGHDNGDTGGHCHDEGQHPVHVEEVSWLTIGVVSIWSISTRNKKRIHWINLSYKNRGKPLCGVLLIQQMKYTITHSCLNNKCV